MVNLNRVPSWDLKEMEEQLGQSGLHRASLVRHVHLRAFNFQIRPLAAKQAAALLGWTSVRANRHLPGMALGSHDGGSDDGDGARRMRCVFFSLL